jgi:hypothetical protein
VVSYHGNRCAGLIVVIERSGPLGQEGNEEPFLVSLRDARRGSLKRCDDGVVDASGNRVRLNDGEETVGVTGELVSGQRDELARYLWGARKPGDLTSDQKSEGRGQYRTAPQLLRQNVKVATTSVAERLRYVNAPPGIAIAQHC